MSDRIVPGDGGEGRSASSGPGHSCSAPSPQAVSASGESPSRIGPQMIPPGPPKFTCKGCPALTTKWWHEVLENDESDSGTTARCNAVEKAITAYWRPSDPPPKWCPGTPPAPCDEPAKREDAIAAEGRSPAGAVDEVEAPDLKSLQGQIQSLSTALAERERRAMEAEAALKPFANFAQEIADTYPGWDHDAFPLFVAEDVELTLAPFRVASALLSALLAREADHER